MNRSPIRFSGWVLLLIGVVVLSAAPSAVFGGTIKGTIFDKDTKDPLPAGNIMLKGTSLGTAANFKGAYTIADVPAGKYTIVVSIIGYEKLSAEVEIPAEGVVEHNFSLKSVTLQGQQVTITAQAQGQLQAINQQIASARITNVVSKSRIQELPDDNAATALSRLPGLSLQDGDKVVIRGIQAKLNTVLINGIQVPSTELNDRSTNLGFISSNLLSGIEVIKALTPDMDANAIGGVVNLRLREAPTGLHFDVFSQANYNTLDRTSDNYKVWASVSKRLLKDNLGIFIQGNADRSDIGQDIASAAFGINGKGNIPYGEAPYQMNSFTLEDQWNVISNGGGSVILDYLLPKGKIVLQNTYANNLSNNTSFRNAYILDTNQGQLAIGRNRYGKDLMINALQTEYNFGRIKTELSLSHSFSNKYTRQRYGDAGQPMNFYNTAARPFGSSEDGKAINFYTQRQFLTLGEALNIPTDPKDAMGASVQGWVVGRGEKFDQHVYNSTLDFTVPVTFMKSISSKIKFGGKYTKSTRKNDVEADFNGSYDDDYYYATTNFFPKHPGISKTNPVLFSDLWDSNYTRGKYFLNGDRHFKFAYDRDLMDRYMKTSISGWAPARHMPYSEREDFNGDEIFSAGYLMTDLNIGPKLSLIGGARYEHYNMNYKAKFVYCTHSVYGYGVVYDTLNTVDRNDDDIFPNIQMRYKATPWADVRFAYTKGISRPDYQAILPKIYYEPGGYAEAGNTKLKPAISTNYDAYVSFYNNKIGLFSIGGFYKQIDNVFFQTSIFYQNLSYYHVSFPGAKLWSALKATPPTPGQNITTYINNPHPAHIKGLEVEWQTHFWYMPQPLNFLVLNVNYTRAQSDMDYQQIRNITQTVRDPRTGRPVNVYTTTDTVRNARLLFQGNDNLNAALGVDYKGLSGRISFNLQGDVITNVGTRPEEDRYTGNIYRWDFTLQQKLPIRGLSFSISGINIFNNKTVTYAKFRRALNGDILKNEASWAYSPRIFQTNLRYSF